MNILSLTYGSSDGFSETSEYFTLEDESITGAQVFSALPISSLGVYTGKVIAAGWDGSETTIIITELGFGPEPDRPLVADFEEGQEDVLDVFFKSHDPTTVDRQGNDIGNQYRSVVFFNLGCLQLEEILRKSVEINGKQCFLSENQ